MHFSCRPLGHLQGSSLRGQTGGRIPLCKRWVALRQPAGSVLPALRDTAFLQAAEAEILARLDADSGMSHVMMAGALDPDFPAADQPAEVETRAKGWQLQVRRAPGAGAASCCWG